MRISLRLISCILAAILIQTTAGCGKGEREAGSTPRPLIRGVTLQKVESSSLPLLFEASGTVKSRNSSVISARIAGTVTAVPAREGERVTRGKLLLTLESAENTAGAAGAEYAVEEAQQALDEAITRKKLADVTFERFEKLYSEQAATRQEFDIRKSEKDLAAQGVARARARLDQARESARAVSAVAGYTRIYSPLTGTVTLKSVDPGMTVFPGTPLMTVEEERYRLEVNVPETLPGRIREGDTVTVSIEGAPSVNTGKIVEVAPRVDAVSRTYPVKIELTGSGMRSGMFGRAMLAAGESKGITIPAKAVLERGQLTYVWAVNVDNVAVMRLVKPGRLHGNSVEILAGLTDGDRIVVGGMDKVTDGARIK